jgi:Cation transport ATPase
LKPGDLVAVKPGETIPADGRVKAGNSLVDCRSITGESEPQKVAPNSFVWGGTINIEAPLEVQVFSSWRADKTVSAAGIGRSCDGK